MIQIRIAGKHIETGDTLPLHVRSRFVAAIGKLFDGGGEASVCFEKEGTGYRSDCSLHLSSGVRLQSRGADSDIYRAFDQALERMEKQVRRYARRLKNRHDRAPRPAGRH